MLKPGRKLWVNGELRQDANTRDLIFDVPTIIETLSALLFTATALLVDSANEPFLSMATV